MPARANERIVYFNGKFIPESQALVPYRDRSFLFGDGAFDLTRTFHHRIFKLDEHLERLYRSMKALRLDPTMPMDRMAEITRTAPPPSLPVGAAVATTGPSSRRAVWWS